MVDPQLLDGARDKRGNRKWKTIFKGKKALREWGDKVQAKGDEAVVRTQKKRAKRTGATAESHPTNAVPAKTSIPTPAKGVRKRKTST